MFAAAFAVATLAPLPQDPPPETVTVRVTATVLDQDFAPLAGVGVAVVEAIDERVASVFDEAVARSGDDGRCAFSIEAPEGTTRWLVFGGRGLAMQTCSVSMRSSRELDLGAFAMAPGVTLAGRVRDAEGDPIEGALVRASDLLDELQHLQEHRRGQTVAFRTAARSDASGFFRLPGMVPYLGRIEVTCDGYFRRRVEPVGMETPIDLELAAAPTIRGVLRAADGAAVAGARISYDGHLVGDSDGEGRFAFSLPHREAGQLYASKTIEGDVRIWGRRQIERGDWDQEIELGLAAPDSEDAGHVVVRAVDAAGNVVEDFTAYVSWNPENQLQYRHAARLLARMESYRDRRWSADAEGGEAKPAGPPARAREEVAVIFVRAEGHGIGRVQRTTPSADAPIVVELPREGTIAGRVTDEVSGEPIQGVRVIPTQRLEDSERSSYASGFRDIDDLLRAPTSTTTDADGRYELRGLPPGVTDLLLHHPDRLFLQPRTLELEEGERREGVDFALPEQVTVAGKVADAPAGAEVRLHWHRPNMWSSGWPSEYDGARRLAADGTFALENRHPKPWEIQVLVASPPRGGPRLKASGSIWTPPADGEDAKPIDVSSPRLVRGTVGGRVPWHRLAVTVQWQRNEHHYQSSVTFHHPFALVRPDRSFAIFAPNCEGDVLVFDPLTGTPLQWQELAAGEEAVEGLEFACDAVPFELVLGWEGEGEPPTCRVEVDVEDEDWPAGVGELADRGSPFAGSQNTRIFTRLRAGSTTTLWLRSREGSLRVLLDDAVLGEADLKSTERLEVTAPSVGR